MTKFLQEVLRLIEFETARVNNHTRDQVCALPDAELLLKLESRLKELRTAMIVNDMTAGMDNDGVKKKYRESGLHTTSIRRVYLGTQTKPPIREI